VFPIPESNKVYNQAKYVVRFLKPEEGKVDVGYIAHPGFVELEELSAITGPLSIAAAGE
jgi:hypothetical protein